MAGAVVAAVRGAAEAAGTEHGHHHRATARATRSVARPRRRLMSTLAWIVVAGLAMSAIALSGASRSCCRERTLDRMLLPLVGLAAGSLLGGAFFHMLPEAIDRAGQPTSRSTCG